MANYRRAEPGLVELGDIDPLTGRSAQPPLVPPSSGTGSWIAALGGWCWMILLTLGLLFVVGGMAYLISQASKQAGCGHGHPKCQNGAPCECKHDDKCDDHRVCTSDYCGEDGLCHHLLLANCCDYATPCVSDDICFSVHCDLENYLCVETPVNPCDDGNLCTVDTCSGDQCHQQWIPHCCLVDSDCTGPNELPPYQCNQTSNRCANMPAQCLGNSWMNYGNQDNWQCGKSTITTRNVNRLTLVGEFSPVLMGRSDSQCTAVEDGVVFCADERSRVYAFYDGTMVQKWVTPQLNTGSSAVIQIRTSPTLGKQRLYVAVVNGTLVALNINTGAELWRTQVTYAGCNLGLSLFASPLLDEDVDMVIVQTSVGTGQSSNTCVGTIQAFFSTNGTFRWVQTTALGTDPALPNYSTMAAVGSFSTGVLNRTAKLAYLPGGQSQQLSPPLPNNQTILSKLTDGVFCLNYLNGSFVWWNQMYQQDLDNFIGQDQYNWDPTGLSLFNMPIDGQLASTPIILVANKQGVVARFHQKTGQRLGLPIVMSNPNPSTSSYGGVNVGGCSNGRYQYYATIYSNTGLPNVFAVRGLPANVSSAVWGIDIATWKISMRTNPDFNGVVLGAPACTNDLVLVSTYFGTVNKYNLTTGLQDLAPTNSSAILRALNSTTGNVEWFFKSPLTNTTSRQASTYGGPMIFNNAVYWHYTTFTGDAVGRFVVV